MIRTKSMSVVWLDDSRNDRPELMDDLKYSGLMSREIAELLNLWKIKSPTNKEYNAKLVERSLYKYKQRQKRLNGWKVHSIKARYCVGIGNIVRA